MRTIIVVFIALTLSSCGGSASAPSVVPGAGGKELYELMDEDSSEVKVDTADTVSAH